MLVYRLGSRRYPPNDGLGASLYGGRWNHKGTPVIYAAASRALIAQEQNYFLNPRHSDFSKVRFLTPEPFQFDDRLRRAWLQR